MFFPGFIPGLAKSTAHRRRSPGSTTEFNLQAFQWRFHSILCAASGHFQSRGTSKTRKSGLTKNNASCTEWVKEICGVFVLCDRPATGLVFSWSINKMPPGALRRRAACSFVHWFSKTAAWRQTESAATLLQLPLPRPPSAICLTLPTCKLPRSASTGSCGSEC